MLPDLLDQIPANEAIGSVTADGAYDTLKCLDAIADRSAHAVIPSRRNAKPWKAITAGAIARNEALRAAKYLGRTLWRRRRGYHRRSRVETKIHCLELLDQWLIARDFDRQIAELQVRIAVLSDYIALGCPSPKLRDDSARGKANSGNQLICATESPAPTTDANPTGKT